MSTDLEAKRLAVLRSMKKAEPPAEPLVKPPLPPLQSVSKPSGVTGLASAVLDLTNLGYGFWQIVEKTGVSTEALAKAFEALGYPVPPTPVQSSTSTPAATESPVSAPVLQSQTPTKSTSPSLPAKPVAPSLLASNQKNHRFGEDRSSHSVRITFSDDDDDDDSDSEDSFEDNTASSRKQTPPNVVNNTGKVDPTNRQKLAETLEAQRAKIRQVAAQLRLLQEQKDNESTTNTPPPESTSPTQNLSVTNNAVSSKVTSAISSFGTSSSENSAPTTLTAKVTPTPSVVPAPTSIHAFTNDVNLKTALQISMKRIKSLSDSLEMFKREQAKLNSQTKLYTKQLENNRMEATKRQVEELKRELERKTAELLDRTYKFASAQASLSAIELQKKKILQGIDQVMNDLKLAKNELEHMRVDTPVPESQPIVGPPEGTINNVPTTAKDLTAQKRLFEEPQEVDSDIEILNIKKHEADITPESKKRKGTELIKVEKRQTLEQPINPSVNGPTTENIAKTEEKPKEEPKRFEFPPKYFTPYESPLKPFKSFRFSPFYKENVSGGYKSLTYSNTITQKKNIVCSNEIFKGKCTNKKCPFLHFAQMTPTDYTILGEMNRAFIGETPEEIEIYKKKLHNRILELGHSSDFSTVADAAIEFRRNYSENLKDRILDWNKFDSIKEKVLKKRSEPVVATSNALLKDLTT